MQGAPHPWAQRAPSRPDPDTHLAESVLMEPVTSMSPARNSWYLVQAIVVDRGDHLNPQLQIGSSGRWCLRLESFRAERHVTLLAPRPVPPRARQPRPRSCCWSAGWGAGEVWGLEGSGQAHRIFSLCLSLSLSRLTVFSSLSPPPPR